MTSRKEKGKSKKERQYELTTSKMGLMDMPYQVFGKNMADVRAKVKKKLRKGEKIISLIPVKW